MQKRGFCPSEGKLPQVMGRSFETELDFRAGHSLESKSSELAALFDLAEHGFGPYRTLAPVPEALLACKQFSCPGLIIIKGVVYFYLSVPF